MPNPLGNSLITPAAFGDKRSQEWASRAAELEQMHTARIRGTSDLQEIRASFKEYRAALARAAPPQDGYHPGSPTSSHDGGMADLARSRFRR